MADPQPPAQPEQPPAQPEQPPAQPEQPPAQPVAANDQPPAEAKEPAPPAEAEAPEPDPAPQPDPEPQPDPQEARIKELQSQIESLQQQHASAESKLQETIETQRKELDALKQQLASVKHRYEVAPSVVHIIDAISAYEQIGIETEDVNKDIRFEEYDNIHKLHVNHLKQWNRTTAKLEAFSKSPVCDEDDAKKKEDASDLICNSLYSRYMECNALMDEQNKRLNQMVSADHVMAILKNSNGLQRQITTNVASTESNDEEQKRLSSEYDGTKKNRIVLQGNIAQEVKDCNAIIGKENQLLTHIKDKDLLLQALQQQHSRLQAVFSNFSAVSNDYSVFEQQNKKFIVEIQKYFREQWTVFESQWSTTWSVVDMVSWFKYKTKGKDTRVINWTQIAEELKQRNITGKSLQSFNDAYIDLIGIKDFAIATHLMKQIQKLRTRYLLKLEKSDASENDGDDDHKNEEPQVPKIPAKFLCPICRQIMMDPVVAFDEMTYDRKCIEAYLQEKGSSPSTNEKAYSLHVFSNHGLRKEVESYCELNDISELEGGHNHQEGKPNTAGGEEENGDMVNIE